MNSQFATSPDHIRIAFDVSGADVARFLIGSDEPDEIIHQTDMECTGIAIPLARVLFPNLHPMMSHWDEY